MNNLTLFRSSLYRLERLLVRAAAPALLLLAALAPFSAAYAQAQSADLLADKTAWALDGTAKFSADGVLQLVAASKEPEYPQAVRGIELPPATAWESELRFSPKPGTTAAGLLLLSADDRWISVLLKPASRGIQVSHGNPLTDDLIGMMGGDNLPFWAAGSEQVLKVRGDGGKVQIWLNGQDLGFGTPYDFEPQRVGVRSEGGPAQFSSLRWQASGSDGRLARLSGTVLIPGQPPLMEEKFNSAAQEMAGGLLGRLTGKKKESNSAGKWPDNARSELSAFTRDTSAKRLRLEGLKDDSDASTNAEPSSTYPLHDAVVAVTARVKLRASPAPAAKAGLYLDGEYDDEDGNLIYVSLYKDQLRLEQFNVETKKWTLLHGYVLPDKDKEVELRLVARGDRAWGFIDRHLVMSQPLEGLRLDTIIGGGLRVEGMGAIEASSFRIDEL